MNNKNENKKMNLDVKVNMIKEFISEISNKKKIIKAFKKRHINYINQNPEKKIESLTLKLYSLNNFITEFEDLIQISLKLILFFQEEIKLRNANKDKGNIINEPENKFYNNENLNIQNLDFDNNHTKTELYIKNIDNNINSSSNIKSKTSDNFRKYIHMSNSLNNTRNNNLMNISNNNKNKRYDYSYNYIKRNDFISLREKTLKTLYNINYLHSHINNINDMDNMDNINNKNIDESKLNISIRKPLRTLIKEKNLSEKENQDINKINKNKINDKEILIKKINENENYKEYFANKYGNGNYSNFLKKYKIGLINEKDIENECLINSSQIKFRKDNSNYFGFNNI